MGSEVALLRFEESAVVRIKNRIADVRQATSYL
jgi:hypothetical protein